MNCESEAIVTCTKSQIYIYAYIFLHLRRCIYVIYINVYFVLFCVFVYTYVKCESEGNVMCTTSQVYICIYLCSCRYVYV